MVLFLSVVVFRFSRKWQALGPFQRRIYSLYIRDLLACAGSLVCILGSFLWKKKTLFYNQNKKDKLCCYHGSVNSFRLTLIPHIYLRPERNQLVSSQYLTCWDYISFSTPFPVIGDLCRLPCRRDYCVPQPPASPISRHRWRATINTMVSTAPGLFNHHPGSRHNVLIFTSHVVFEGVKFTS